MLILLLNIYFSKSLTISEISVTVITHWWLQYLLREKLYVQMKMHKIKQERHKYNKKCNEKTYRNC